VKENKSSFCILWGNAYDACILFLRSRVEKILQ